MLPTFPASLSYVESGSLPLTSIEQDLQDNLVSINVSQPSHLHPIKIHNTTNLRCETVLITLCTAVLMMMMMMMISYY